MGRISTLDLLDVLLLMQSKIQLAFWAVSAHCQLMSNFSVHQYSQVLLHRATLNPFISQSVLLLGIVPTQVQDLALGLVELCEVCTGPLLKPVKVPLGGIICL